MDWSFLGRPEFIAPVAGVAGVLIGSGISAWTTKSIHRERLAADQNLAERKFEFDKDLAERRINADTKLAEKKLALDRELAAWQRRTELAEEVLASFYQAKEIIDSARSPGSLGGEGRTRPREPWENEEDTRLLDAYFQTLERLKDQYEPLAQLFARRYRFMALFGNDAGKPFLDFWRIRGEILIDVRLLINTYKQREMGSLPDDRKKWETTIGRVQTEKDPIASRLERIIEDIEKICRPVIQNVAN
jgi:hypothetical protein